MHSRTLVRTFVHAALDGATDAGSRVFKSRIRPMRLVDLPAIGIYTLSDSIDKEATQEQSPRFKVRDIELRIEAMIRDNDADTAADTMDDLCEQIESAIEADPQFGGLVEDTVLESTEIGLIEEGSKPTVAAVLSYTVRVYDKATTTPASLDDFERGHATHKIDGPTMPDDDDVEDLFDVQ